MDAICTQQNWSLLLPLTTPKKGQLSAERQAVRLRVPGDPDLLIPRAVGVR